MAKRNCYQCGGEDLEEVQARRKAQVRAWADEQIRVADQALVGVPLFKADLSELDEEVVVVDDVSEIEIPDQEISVIPVKATPKKVK